MKKFGMLKIMVITLSLILILIPIYTYGAGRWEQIDEGAVQISVDNRGTPWVVHSEDYIYVWKSFNWKSIQEYFGILFKK